MKPVRTLGRRSFLGRVIGGAAGAGALALLAGPAAAQKVQAANRQNRRPTGMTDRDSGPAADGEDYGRTNLTDRDQGPTGDPEGFGRGRSLTMADRDQAPTADPPAAPRGRRLAGCSDTDIGPNSDPSGQGRGAYQVAEADSGRYADPVGPRRCRNDPRS